MDAFELARRKYEKNKAKNDRYRLPVAEPVEQPEAESPKESEERSADAVISITVTLPTGEHRITLRKRDVLQNVPNHRLTEREFRNAIVNGLMPLLGAVT